MFEEEFSNLPPIVANALRKRLEEVVRFINQRAATVARDATVQGYSAEALSAMISSIFDLADKIRTDLEASRDVS